MRDSGGCWDRTASLSQTLTVELCVHTETFSTQNEKHIFTVKRLKSLTDSKCYGICLCLYVGVFVLDLEGFRSESMVIVGGHWGGGGAQLYLSTNICLLDSWLLDTVYRLQLFTSVC